MRVLASVLCASLLFVVHDGLAAEQQLNAASIKSTLPGARMYARNGTVLVDWKADGTLLGSTVRGVSDSGKWWVEGDLYCRQWQSWGDGKKACWTLYLDGDKLRFFSSETKKSETTKLVK